MSVLKGSPMRQWLETLAVAFFLVIALTFGGSDDAYAQPIVAAQTVTACGTPNNTPVVGNSYPVTQDTTGKLCTAASGGGGGAVTMASGAVASGAYSSGALASGSVAAGAIVDLGTGGSPAANTVNARLATLNTTLNSPMQNSGGSVTANAGTNLNTSALDLEATQSAFKTANHTDTIAITAALGSPFQAGGSIGNTAFGITGAVPAGTNLIGKVGIDQTTPGTTNGVQINAALPAGTNLIGKTGIDQTTPGSTNGVSLVPTASGGASHFSEIVANNTTSVAIDASPGQLYGISAFNNSATIAYVKLYNAAQGSTTCGSGTPVERFMIPASGGFVKEIVQGDAFPTAITVCVTTGIADADTGAPAASTYIVNALYK
jgi:hypothetical protein